MKKKQKLKERICALVLALAMVLTWVLPDAGMTVQAAGGTEVEYTVSVTDEDGALADVSVSAQTGDTAAVTAKTGQNGKATLTLTKDAEYTVTLAKEGYETHTANVTPTEQNTQMNQKLRFKPFTITASDSTIAGQNVTLQIANPVAGVSYQWTANGASAAPTSGTGTSFNITCAAAGTVNVTAAAKGQTASKSIIVNKKTINTSDISISLDPDQGAVNKISVTVAGFPADAEGQVTLQYSYQGSTYTKTASKTKDITSVVIVLNAEQDVFFGKLNCTVSYANDALYNDFSGVNKDAVYRKTHELTSEQKIELDTDNDGKKEEVYGQEITYGECIDKAGNVDYFSSEFAVVADQTKPEIEITNLSTPRNGIFKGDVKLHIEVTDPENNKTYSGLEEVWYDVKASGNVVKEVRYPSLVDNSANPVKGNQSWSGDITIPAAEYNSNDVKVQVHARDFSGNVYDSEIVPLKIDITHPTIAVTYDLNTPLNERYYKDVRTATVVVIERNFDESAVRFNITNTDGTQPAISGWTHSANAGVSDDATHTCQVTFAADGDYTFTLETTDLAGNASSYNRVDDFTIDRTVPTIQVSYDNNSAATPGYFNANRTATVTVNEHNFNAAEVNAQITAALQGSGVAAPGLGGWSTNGDVHTASVTFSADADYTFDVDYTDLAGNAAADYTQDKFTVDKTDPEVEFFDIEDKSANNGTVAPGVKYSDVNYMESGVDITIKGAKHDKTELSGNRTNIANGESIKMEDFKHDEETDDVYTMTAVIKDKAGNETEKEVMFSVNRFGSNYIFSETTEKFLDDVYANKPKDLVVTEVNVDSLVFNGISYGLDGTKKELKPGSDYTVKQSGGEGSWKEYTYTIKKENFEKEGRYSVTIDSEDKATNKMNNKVKECNIDFVIDKTPPTVVITGIEESSYRADEREMTINLSDNTAVKSVDVIIDGRSVATYAQKEIEKAGGKISYMIEGASEPQKIEAAALDMAGNETTSEMHKVLVTSSVWIQYINNTPLLIGSILGIVLVAGGLIWFFVIRKKKEESK